ncbi:unnamed protein product [Mortierella alpina]
MSASGRPPFAPASPRAVRGTAIAPVMVHTISSSVGPVGQRTPAESISTASPPAASSTLSSFLFPSFSSSSLPSPPPPSSSSSSSSCSSFSPSSFSSSFPSPFCSSSPALPSSADRALLSSSSHSAAEAVRSSDPPSLILRPSSPLSFSFSSEFSSSLPSLESPPPLPSLATTSSSPHSSSLPTTPSSYTSSSAVPLSPSCSSKSVSDLESTIHISGGTSDSSRGSSITGDRPFIPTLTFAPTHIPATTDTGAFPIASRNSSSNLPRSSSSTFSGAFSPTTDSSTSSPLSASPSALRDSEIPPLQLTHSKPISLPTLNSSDMARRQSCSDLPPTSIIIPPFSRSSSPPYIAKVNSHSKSASTDMRSSVKSRLLRNWIGQNGQQEYKVLERSLAR